MSKITLKNVRLSFPSLWSTEIYNGVDTEKFGATFLIEKDDKQAKVLKDAIKAVAEEKFGKNLPKSLKYCLVDGDEKDYDGYANMWAIKASTKKRPTVIDRQKSPVVESDGTVYAGCYVNASIDIWAMDNSYGKRILASLNGVQFFKDGDSFSSGGNVLDDFDSFDDGEDDDSDPFA